jgi:hypothetical protein
MSADWWLVVCHSLAYSRSLSLCHAAVSAGIRQQLRLALLTVARLKPLDTRKAPKPLPTQPLQLRRVEWQNPAGGAASSAGDGATQNRVCSGSLVSGTTASNQPRFALARIGAVPPSDAAILAAFSSFRSQANGAAGLHPAAHGSLIRLVVDDEAGAANVECHVLLKFDMEQLLLCEPDPENEDAPGEPTPAAKADIGLQNLYWVDGDTCPDVAKVTVGLPIELSLVSEHFFDGPSLEQVAGVEEAKGDLDKFLRASIYGAQQRLRLHMPSAGGMLVTGASGTGKTTLVSAVAREFRSPSSHSSNSRIGPQPPAFFLRVDCASFVSAKAKTVKASWRKIWKEAQRNAPSIVLVDDLDLLVPATKEGAARETNALGQVCTADPSTCCGCVLVVHVCPDACTGWSGYLRSFSRRSFIRPGRRSVQPARLPWWVASRASPLCCRCCASPADSTRRRLSGCPM